MKVKAIRELRGLSIRALAAKAKMSFTYLFNVESGKADPSLTTLNRLANALNVSTKTIVPHHIRRHSMKPKLDTYEEVERAVEMIEEGKLTKREDVERVLLRCFAKKILSHKPSCKSTWDPKFQNGRGLALELVRNLHRYYDL